MIASTTKLDNEDVHVTVPDCNSVSATVIDDTRVECYPCSCNEGILWMIVSAIVFVCKEKSDLSARPNTIEMRGEPSLRRLWKG